MFKGTYILLGLLLISTFIYFSTETHEEAQVTESFPEESQHFSLGKRLPSSASIDHDLNILPQKKSDISLKDAPVNQGATFGRNDPKETKVIPRAPHVAQSPFISNARRKKTFIPSEIENFTNPRELKGSETSSSDSSSIVFFNQGMSGPDAQQDSSSGNPSPSKVAEPKPFILTGYVKPLVGLITSHSVFSSFEAYASGPCTTPKVGIYKTTDLLKLNQAPIQEQELNSQAEFSFRPDPSIDITRPQDYVLQVTGCDTLLARIITAFSSNQNIQLSSTLLSYTQVAPLNAKPTDVPLDQLLVNLEAKESQYNDLVDAFQELDSNLATNFTNTFNGSTTEDLKNSLPVIRGITVPSNLTEGVASTLLVDAYHWFPGYDLAAEWFVNGVSRGFGLSWNWTPPGNSPLNVVIDVRIGYKKLLQDQIDTSRPYHQISFNRSIVNAIVPQPPVLAVDTPIPTLTASPLIPLIITTGADMGDGTFNYCSSFTSMALTETPISPDVGDFNIICSEANFQDLVHSLASTNRTDGLKTLYLWAKDDMDDISSIPSTVSVYLDQTPPLINFASSSAIYGGNTSFNIVWEMTENSSSSTQNFVMEFFDGSSWNVLPDVPAMNGPLNLQDFSSAYTLPDANIDNARFRVSFTDLVGNSAIEMSPTFNIRVPNLSVSPLSHNFGDVLAQSTSSPVTFTFSNTGQWPTVSCSSPVLTGDSTQFTITSENCSNAALASGGSCSIQVVANPALRQAYNSNLSLTCGTKSASATIMVTGDNNPPTIASGTSTTLNEDNTHNFSLVAGTDLDGDSLTYSIVSSPSNGTLSNCLASTNDLSCTYTPNLNYNGSDSFTYQAWDGQNYSSPVTVNLTITPVNDAPVLALTQSESVDEDDSLSFNLNAGTDIENDTLIYIIVTSTSNGVLSCSGGTSRSCSYTPGANFNGTDSFTYKVNDGNLDSTTATVTITVNALNDTPTPGADFAQSVNEDDVLNFSLAQGSDIDLPAQTLTYSLVTAPAHGTLSNCIESGPSTDISCTYTPDADYNGSDSFTYRVCDPLICSTAVTTVSLTVTPVNDPPVMASNQSFSLNDDEFVDFTLSGASDIDLPAQTLTYKVFTALSQGTLANCINNSSWTGDLTCRFTPPVNFQGSLSFTYKAYDSIDESSASSTVTFNISDKTPSPSPVIALASPYYTNDTSISITNSSCSDIDELYVSANSTTPLPGAAGWVPCTTVAGALSATLSTMNGLHTVYVWSKDQYDNVQPTPDSIEVIFDNTLPVIDILGHNVIGNKNNTIFFTLTEANSSPSQNFLVEYHNGTSWSSTNEAVTNGPHVNKSFSTDIFAPNSDNTLLTLKITYTDLAGNQTVVTEQFRSDLSEPVVDLLSINGGATTTSNNNVLVQLNAHDDLSKVSAFCLKYNDSAKPAANASCWRDVNAPSPGITPSPSITFNNYYFQVGFVKSTYAIYAWVKDEAGQISSNSGILDVDKYDIYFDPGTPPQISNIQATNSDAPNNPINSSDLVALSGQNIYIKWYASDPEGMGANPMSIEYTLNDKDFFPFAGGVGENLLNSANGSCTVDAGFTGCAVLPAPSSSYFKVRVVAKDDVETTVFLNPAPFNDSNLSIIAGNTEHGLEGSALSAIFYAYGSTKTNSYVYKHNLVVSEDGKFFYLDKLRGLLWVNPTTGVLTTFIPTTGTTSGDGGPVASATLRSPSGIILDATNNLLIWDYNRIRKVNLSTMTITHLIGGGAQSGTTSVINATDFNLAGLDRRYGTFIPMPNGDIIFNSPSNSVNYRRYRASDNKIEPMNLTGEGITGYPTISWSDSTITARRDLGIVYNTTTSEILFMAKAFNKQFTGDGYPIYARIDHTSGNATTPYEAIGPHNFSFFNRGSVITGLDGKIYQVDRFRRNIFRYNLDTNNLTNILGTGSTASAPCPDDTPATSCAVDIDTYFVTKTGRVYFLDNGIVRTIDDSNKVITLFGQFPSFGNGSLATIARFGDIVDIDLDVSSNKLIIQDGLSNEFRNFTIGSTLSHLTNYSFTSTGPYRFFVDQSTGDFFSTNGTGVRRFVRSTNSWITPVGGGSIPYYSVTADGKPGSQIDYVSGYPRNLVGYLNNTLFYYKNAWNGSAYHSCMVKSYDVLSSYTQQHFIGDGTCSTKATIGGLLADQVFEPTNMEYFVDPNDSISKYFFGRVGANHIYTAQQGGTLQLFATLPRGFNSFTYTLSGGLKFFYCSGGQLYRYTHATAEEELLPWASPTIQCKSSRQSIIYNSARNSIMFVFTQNGLDGVGEYKLPP